MTNYDKGFYPNDIVVGKKVPFTVIKKLNNETLVVILVEGKLIFRRLYITKNKAVLRADHKNIEDSTYLISDIKEMCRVRYVSYRHIPEIADGMEDKLLMIEHQLLEMKKRMNS